MFVGTGKVRGTRRRRHREPSPVPGLADDADN